MSFQNLNLKKELTEALASLGYEQPTLIQEQIIPEILKNKDIIGKSQTGTGKTAAFLLPILERINVRSKQNQAVIICPTRELADQVYGQIKKYGKFLGQLKAVLVCGKQSMANQKFHLKSSHIIVGTPGRLFDHIERGSIDLSGIKTFVLDEADEMLKSNFKDEINNILQEVPTDTQILLFSATMSPEVLEIAKSYQKDPITVDIQANKSEEKKIEQFYFYNKNISKLEQLKTLLTNFDSKMTIIFSNTKECTEKVGVFLKENRIWNSIIHGNKTQSQRNYALKDFRTGRKKILVATNVAARGIDVSAVDLVINFDIPQEIEAYTHRIGRTARGRNTTGTAITLISSNDDIIQMQKIEKKENYKISPLINEKLESEVITFVKRERSFDDNRGGWNRNRSYRGNNSGAGRSAGGNNSGRSSYRDRATSDFRGDFDKKRPRSAAGGFQQRNRFRNNWSNKQESRYE